MSCTLDVTSSMFD